MTVFRYSERRISISRTLSAILAILTILAAGVVFEEKREAGRMSGEVARLKRGIELEKERISELKAEWALLDQPARLQAIVEAHPKDFALEPILPTQIGRIGDLPWRPVRPPEDAAEGGDPAAARDDPAAPHGGAAHGASGAPALPVKAAPDVAGPGADPLAELMQRQQADPPTTGSVAPAEPTVPTVEE